MQSAEAWLRGSVLSLEKWFTVYLRKRYFIKTLCFFYFALYIWIVFCHILTMYIFQCSAVTSIILIWYFESYGTSWCWWNSARGLRKQRRAYQQLITHKNSCWRDSFPFLPVLARNANGVKLYTCPHIIHCEHMAHGTVFANLPLRGRMTFQRIMAHRGMVSW